jgi:hypothetical protein
MVRIPRDWRVKTEVIHSPELMEPGESITIKGWFSDHDRQRVLSAAVEQVRQPDGTAVTRATLDRLRATKRALAVQGWTLLDEEGQALPFDEDTLLHALPSDLADWLDLQIDRVWDGLGTPVANADEAARLEREAKEQRSQFRGDGLSALERTETGSASDDGAGARDPGAGDTGAAPAAPVEIVRDRPLEPAELPGADPR